MKPCACGFHGDRAVSCRCTPDQIKRYRQRLSGPLLDRIDMQLCVERVAVEALTGNHQGEATAVVAKRVQRARRIAMESRGKVNARIEQSLKHDDCKLDKATTQLLHDAAKKFHLSARVIAKLVGVSRTIADLAGEEMIGRDHLAEALSLRVGMTGV